MAIAPILNKNVEDNTMLIPGTPEIVLCSLDSNKHFVYVPLVSRPWLTAAQAIGERSAECIAPSPHCLIGAQQRLRRTIMDENGGNAGRRPQPRDAVDGIIAGYFHGRRQCPA
jgi:hypothetical protein